MAGSNLKGSVPISNIVSTESPPASPTKEVIYWAPAKQYQAGNFKPEIRNQADRIVQHEQSLRFSEHVFTTSDPEKIAFIEDTSAFEVGQIKKCKDREEAQNLTLQQAAMKSVKTLHSDHTEKIVVGEGGG